MYLPSNPARPSLPERHKTFLNINAINELISMLETVYNQTGNETVHIVALRLIHVKDQALARFWDEETHWRIDEIKEAFGNLDELPYAVKVWLLDYREQEMD